MTAKDSGLRVAVLGAASPQWGATIVRDLVVRLSGDSGCAGLKPVVVLEDVDGRNLKPSLELGRRLALRTGDRVRVEATTDQRAALTGAHFVVVSIAVGSLEAMQPDVEIPCEYGIFMPVGDTASIGGAIRAARNVPAFLSIARDTEEVGAPGAWVLNLSNPMSILVRALTRESGVPAVGLCHEIYKGIALMCRLADAPFAEWRRLLDASVVGINHNAWLTRCSVGGEDMLARLRTELEQRGFTLDSRRLYDSDMPDLRGDNVKYCLFLRHGVLPYSGDRHNVEFFREFCNAETNKGADWGVLLTSVQSRLLDHRGASRQGLSETLAGKRPLDMALSNESASAIVKAIAVNEPLRDVGNLPYEGDAMPGVPRGAVLERLCTYDGAGAHPEAVDPLPAAVQEHLALHCGIIEDVVEAAVTGNRDRMLAALERDPLLGNMDRGRIPELWDRVAEASRAHLHPGFFRGRPVGQARAGVE